MIEPDQREGSLPPLFGLVHATDPRTADRLRQHGIQTVKTDQLFDLLGEVRDEGGGRLSYDGTRLVAVVRTITGMGAQPVLGLDFTPVVLSTRPHLENSARRSVPPTDYRAWERLVTVAVERARRDAGQRGVDWEVWNEPDLGLFWDVNARTVTRWAGLARDAEVWTPSPVRPAAAGEFNDIARLIEYIRLYRASVRGANQADSTARVGGPGTSSFRPRWIKGLLNACAEQRLRVDFLSWHYPASPDDIPETVRMARHWTRRLPSRTPSIFITEWNERIVPSRADLQAATAVLSFLKAFADAGVTRSLYYATTALWDSTMTPTPVMMAFEAFAHLRGDRVRGRPSSHADGIATVGPKGRLSVLFWTATPERVPLRIVIRGRTAGNHREPYVMSLIETAAGAAYRTSTSHGRLAASPSPSSAEAWLMTTVSGPAFGVLTVDLDGTGG
ncbi:MAG: hypothetical protein HY710_09300 [Candidatus Latescibacteria bacterium]|nr:hypothetical protein [Candidatus Latescibacterota bacterium]